MKQKEEEEELLLRSKTQQDLFYESFLRFDQA